MLVNSVYESISGETSAIPQGSFVTILRLSKCNLNCKWPCDSPEARDGIGKELHLEDIFKATRGYRNWNLLITGGEPLLQQDELERLIIMYAVMSDRICSNIIIETNGTIKPNNTIFRNTNLVVDFKMPSSGHFKDMDINNYFDLRKDDYIKFVCDSKIDVQTAIDVSRYLIHRNCRAKMAIGQTWRWLREKKFNLVNYLISENAKYFILNYQLHKFLNVD